MSGNGNMMADLSGKAEQMVEEGITGCYRESFDMYS